MTRKAPPPLSAAQPPSVSEGFWIFGYGSLIWDPGFDPEERCIARLGGYRRSFCLASLVHRGRPEHPGLVLALDAEQGAHCDGLALRVPAMQSAAVLEALRARELVTDAYREAWLPVELADGRQVTAVTYVIDPGHHQYAGGLDLETQAGIIAAAHGGRGPNRDYLFNTTRHLADLGLPDPELEALVTLVRRIVG